MSKSKLVLSLLAVSVFLIVVSGCSSEKKSESTKQTSVSKAQDSKVEDSVATQSNEPGIFKDYSATVVSEAKSTDKIILFFHASWCPTCKSIEKDINANLEAIPSGVKILKVDYDSESELKKKYDVRQQYTMVQIDNQGEKLKLWNDSYSLNDILETSA